MCHSEGVSQMLCLTVDEYNHVIINDQNTDDAGCNITELCRDECEEVCGLTRNEIVPPSLRKIMALTSTQDIDPCDSQPCYNDGTCTSLLSLAFCYCEPPFYGTRCEASRADIERKTTVILSIFLFLVVCVILLELVIFLRIRFCTGIRNEEKENISCKAENICERSEIETDVDPLLKNKEVSHDKVILREMLGGGEFGVVYKGVVHGINRNNEEVICAVKLAKVGVLHEAKEDLLSEIKLLADLGDHRNILSLLACCSREEPYYLITEFMKYGDLLTFLRKCRKMNSVDKDPSYYINEAKQVFIAFEIANGMAYIEEKRFCHGDLAARNILVGDNLKIKISDFGLADDIYTRGYKRCEVGQKIPIKWCSLETILKGICTSQGDVWSFAVLLYEVFTLGGTPYPGIPARYLVSQLRRGYRMEQTENCPDDIYELMLSCWKEDPNDRPTFHAIREQLDDMLVKKSDYLEFEQEDETYNDTAEGDHLKRASYMSNIFYQNFKYQSAEKQRGEGATAVERFAPILEEENDIELTELEAILQIEH
ncbi:Proto-oncogene tyrosine-protein kinase receptor Ret [Holothuria leucospilota]|uniref:Proto-oncogene tyrosine-protein kinase receptor Ret n=1 Tax=Holothuria leucospilota TaxID=206669 RepID=A0A9Q0YQP7_HOLLE|nr:Proto-oncogene tyrosine-protein kinase receptor Ret [Holothuria leucospilota]